MTRWHPPPNSLGRVLATSVVVLLLGLSLVVFDPHGGARPASTWTLVPQVVRSAVTGNATTQLVMDGQTGLGPAGNTPSTLAFDNRTGEMFAIELPWYLVILKGNPPSLIGSVFLGSNSWPESVAVDPANDTVFVGSYPSNILVVSGSTHAIVAQVNLTVDPQLLAYDPTTGTVYAGGNDQTLTAVNATNYAVTYIGPTGTLQYSTENALVYDPAVGDLVLMGVNECICGLTSGLVVGIDPTTGNYTWSASTFTFDFYTAMSVDDATGAVYLTTYSGNLITLNGTSGAQISEVSMPGNTGCSYYPQATAMAYDGNSSDLLIAECGGVVRPIYTSNDTVGPALSVGGMPAAIAIDTSTGDAFVANWDTSTVAVLSANGSALQGYLAVGGAPEAVAVDDASGTAYVLGANNLTVVNLSTQMRVTSIPAGVNASTLTSGGGTFAPFVWASPQSVLYDPQSQEVFAANSGNNTVSVISTATNSLIAVVPVATEPLALALDNVTNQVYVACTGELDVLSAETLVVGANVSLRGFAPGGIAFVPSLDEIVLDESSLLTDSSPRLLVVSAANNTTVGSIPLPSTATTTGEIVYDPGTGDLYVAGSWLGLDVSSTNDTIVDPVTGTVVGNVTVGEDPNAIAPEAGSTRLFAAAGLNATVEMFDGVTGAVLRTDNLSADSYPEGLAYSPSTDQVLVTDWGSDALTYLTTQDVYPVLFSETGLPDGTNWSVSLRGQTNLSDTSVVAFVEPNGTWTYRVGSVAGYTATTATGTVSVNGSAPHVEVRFAPIPRATYLVTFTETGLSSGTNWSVTLNGATNHSNSTEIQFEEPNGSYAFTVGFLGNAEPAPYSGIVNVSGGPVNRSITFTAVCFGFGGCGKWAVVFTESGLPTGTNWSITINGSTFRSDTPWITLLFENGTYPYSVGQLPAYSEAPASGQVIVSGVSVTVGITFTLILTPPTHGSVTTYLGLSDIEVELLIGAVVAVALIATVIVLSRRRRR